MLFIELNTPKLDDRKNMSENLKIFQKTDSDHSATELGTKYTFTKCDSKKLSFFSLSNIYPIQMNSDHQGRKSVENFQSRILPHCQPAPNPPPRHF